MTTKQMDYILMLAQTLNFNRAAENLFISQPTLTYQIKAAEEEIGFLIFARSGKGAALTPAGAQFCTTLRNVRDELNRAIEQGQNINILYKEDVRIGLPNRSYIHLLPQAIMKYAEVSPSVSISPLFHPFDTMDLFLKGELDIVVAMKEETLRIPDIKVHELYVSPIYLISEKTDPLAQKEVLTANDLAGRTLMVGGGSPPALKAVQQRVIAETGVNYFNSADHETTLTNVASHKGICLAPGFLNDHTGEFAWTRFDCKESFTMVLCTHAGEQRPAVQQFVKILQDCYRRGS